MLKIISKNASFERGIAEKNLGDKERNPTRSESQPLDLLAYVRIVAEDAGGG